MDFTRLQSNKTPPCIKKKLFELSTDSDLLGARAFYMYDTNNTHRIVVIVCMRVGLVLYGHGDEVGPRAGPLPPRGVRVLVSAGVAC